MTDKTDSKERDAKAAETWLRDKYGAYRGHFAWRELEEAFLAGRASLAASAVTAITPETGNSATEQGAAITSESGAASAGSEPVYQARYQKGFWQDSSRERYEYLQNPEITSAEDWETRVLYTHPSPPEGTVGGWIALPGTLPEPGTPVLLDIGKEYPIRAMWAAKHTVQAADDDTDWGEYVEADDKYYAPEGWYEWNEHEDNHWRVTAEPRAWAPLPPTTSAGSKGE